MSAPAFDPAPAGSARILKAPWKLGAKGRPIASGAVVWILLSNGPFTLRQSGPTNHDDFGGVRLASAVVLLIAAARWSVSAQLQRTTRGPRSTVAPRHAVIDPDLM